MTPQVAMSEQATGEAPAGGDDGDKTPEGDRISVSDGDGLVDGPVLDIWGNEVGIARVTCSCCWDVTVK